jgi:hypothetical protein
VDAKELKKIAKQMKLLGITHLKTSEFELTMALEAVCQTPPQPKVEPVKEITEDEKKEIEHKMEELKSLMLGSDEDLIERLFPMPVEEEQSVTNGL